MQGKLLIDLMKCRDCSTCSVTCSYFYHPANNGVAALRELAAFLVSCRRCADSPCMHVCPAGALEKDKDGLLHRATNLCIACKSCVAICPFGTLMNDFFDYRSSLCDFCAHLEFPACVGSCDQKALSVTGADQSEEKGLYQIHEHALVRDNSWEIMKNEPQEDYLPNEDII